MTAVISLSHFAMAGDASSLSVKEQDVYLYFKDNPDLFSKRVYVDDILECEGKQTICSDIGEVYLFEVNPLSKIPVKADLLLKTVRKEFVEDPIFWKKGYKKSMTLRSSGREISQAEIKHALEQSLNSFEKEHVRLSVSRLSFSESFNSYLGEIRVDCSSFQKLVDINSFGRGGSQTIRGSCKLESYYNNRISDLDLKFVVQIFLEKRVLVASRNIKSREVIRESMVSYKWVRNSNESIEMKDVLGKIARYSIRSGRQIRKKMTKEKSLVSRGQIIDAILEVGSLKIKNKAKTLSDGVVGERVSAKLIPSSKKVVGLIENDGSLKVSL